MVTVISLFLVLYLFLLRVCAFIYFENYILRLHFSVRYAICIYKYVLLWDFKNLYYETLFFNDSHSSILFVYIINKYHKNVLTSTEFRDKTH